MSKKITRIKKCKNKVVVYFNKEKLDLSLSTFTSFYLYEGKELTIKEIKDIKLFDESSKLDVYALSLIKKSRYSEWKLREKLYLKDNNKEHVDKSIKKLKKSGLIDDESFADDLLDYLNSKNYGKNKIKEIMSNKGIFPETINKLNFPYEEEMKKAKNLMPSLLNKYSKYNHEQKKIHIYNALIAKGFDNEIANTLTNTLNDKNINDELSKLKKDYSLIKTKLSKKYKGKELNDKIISSLMMKGYKYQDIIKAR